MKEDEWETARHCDGCDLHGRKVFAWGKPWGKDKHGFPIYLIFCKQCKWTMQSDKTWNGH